MRKGLIAAIVAVLLFAVGVFAAQFAVNTEDVASGSDAVEKCAELVDVDFVTTYDNAGDWNVTAAELTFYDGSNNTTTECGGFGANLAVSTGAADPAATGISVIPAGSSTVTVSISPTLKASAVTGSAVLVDGQRLQTPTPGQGF
jgi:hypothetical protein